MDVLRIANKRVGGKYPTFIIAEGGINHNGKIKIAKQIVDEAIRSGVDAIKFQTFKADDLTTPQSIYYKLFKKLELSDEEFSEISDYAKQHSIIFLSTPFSNDAVDLLDRLRVPAFKIASGDLTDLPLIRYIASKDKPVILSTGLGNMKEVSSAVNEIKKKKNNKIAILHSVSTYPTPYNETNLLSINTMRTRYQYPIGYSDNGSDMLVSLIAVAVGAKIIEKHFTVNKKMNGPDHKLSADPNEMTQLVNDIRKVEIILGDGVKKCQKSEISGLVSMRRSLIANKDLRSGSILTYDSLKISRPAKGLSPKFLTQVIGMTLKKSIKKNVPLTWNHLQ